MQNKLTSECDSLRKALEVARREVANARRLQRDAEGRVGTIEAQLRAQETKLEAMRRRLEKPGSDGQSRGTEKEERIKSLQALCAQKQDENRQLRTQLAERAAKHSAASRMRWGG